MSENPTTPRNHVRLTSRTALVIGLGVAGLVVGAALAWMTAPADSWTATAKVRYIAPPYGIQGAPTADTVVALALEPSVQASAAAALHVEASRLSGARAAIDSRDKSIALISVSAPTRARALAFAAKLSAVARADAVRAVSRFVTAARDRVSQDEADKRLTEERARALEREAAAASGADPAYREDLAAKLHAVRLAQLGYDRQLTQDRFELDRATDTITALGAPAATHTSRALHLASGTARGGLIGVVLGAFLLGLGVPRRPE